MSLLKVIRPCVMKRTYLISFIGLAMIMILSVVLPNMYRNAYGAYAKATPLSGGPIINNPNLKTELVAKGLRFPTSMAFLGPNDILVLEKNEGTVRRVTDGKLVSKS